MGPSQSDDVKWISQKEPTKCDRVVEFIIPVFLDCSTCFGSYTAHHQEHKNCNCSLWFWQPKTYVKSEAAITVFELLMMGGVSPETCWAIKKHWNNKFYYTVASCWFFLWDLYCDARIHDTSRCEMNYANSKWDTFWNTNGKPQRSIKA